MRLRAVLVAMSLILILASCSKDTPKETVTLKVATYSSKNFERDFGLAFREANPHIRLEYTGIPDIANNESAVQRWMNEEQPDLIVSGGYFYYSLVEAGIVVSLDGLVQRHGYDLAGYPASVMASLKPAAGDDALYGIPSDIHSLALFYNKAIFDRYRLDYPSDGMTWSDLMRVAASFPDEDDQGNKQYGLVSAGKNAADSRLFQLIEYAGRTEWLAPADMNGQAGTLHTEAWTAIWNSIIEGYRAGAIDFVPIREEEDQPFEGVISTEKYWPFLEGQAAMILANSDLLPLLRMDDAMKDWGMAAPPGTYQAFLQPADIYSIAKQSSVQEEAWALLEFANSDAIARQKAAVKNQFTGMIPAKIAIPESSWKLDLSPFYSQEVVPKGLFLYDAIPEEAYAFYSEQAVRAVGDVLAERQTVEEALASLEALLTAELRRQ